MHEECRDNIQSSLRIDIRTEWFIRRITSDWGTDRRGFLEISAAPFTGRVVVLRARENWQGRLLYFFCSSLICAAALVYSDKAHLTRLVVGSWIGWGNFRQNYLAELAPSLTWNLNTIRIYQYVCMPWWDVKHVRWGIQLGIEKLRISESSVCLRSSS